MAPHYFDPSPGAASRPASVELRLPDLSVTLATDRGVFSAGAVDAGTAELLRAGAPGGPAWSGPVAGDLLDLGCGYGPIAVALARRHPAATVWAVDVNSRALELAAANAAALGLANLRAVSPGGVPAGVAFEQVWSNPPIRVGKPARLAPGGKAWLVVQRNLGADSLAGWLSGRGYAVRRAASKRGYRILAVTPE
jgi:16S rRNA (guanine1207-N2)-methyltransferase